MWEIQLICLGLSLCHLGLFAFETMQFFEPLPEGDSRTHHGMHAANHLVFFAMWAIVALM